MNFFIHNPEIVATTVPATANPNENNYITIDFMAGILEKYTVYIKEPGNAVVDKVIKIGTDNKKYILYNKPEIPPHDALKEELSHFINSIQNSLRPKTDGYSAAKALHIGLEIQSIIDQ